MKILVSPFDFLKHFDFYLLYHAFLLLISSVYPQQRKIYNFEVTAGFYENIHCRFFSLPRAVSEYLY